MKYQVHGIRTMVVSIDVDAANEEEALEVAMDSDQRDADVWDSDTEWNFVTPS